MIPSAARRYWRLNDPAAAKIANAFKWSGQPPKINPSLGGSAPHLDMGPWSHPSLQPKRHLDQFSRFCTAHSRVSHYFTMGRYVSPQIARSLGSPI